MITIKNSVFDVQGASKKEAVYGVVLNGEEDVVISNCHFKNQGYSAILNHCTGNVLVENCEFDCDTMYNPIEGSQKVDNGNVVVRGCHFNGAPGNNYINFYQMADGSMHEIVDCSFAPTVDNNVIRFSNRTSAAANILVKNCVYNFTEGTPSDYTGMILCQDYTNKNGVKQDFTKLNIVLDNIVCDGEKLSAQKGAKTGSVYYVYEDGAGIITGNNDPVVVVK